jgi:hypothetical protein
MPLKVKESVDRAEKEREDEERREKAGAEHFRERGLSTPWKLAPVVTQVADAVSAATTGGKELNPLAKGLVKKPYLTVPIKAALGAGASYVANKYAKKYGNTAGKIIAGVASVPGAVGTASNIRAEIRSKNRK